MLELSSIGQDQYGMAFGGDTLNTSIYLSRLGIGTDYITALGDDPLSDIMLQRWQEEHVGTQTVLRLPGRLPGLYMIRRDAKGERSFLYWRSAAPARDLFDVATAEFFDRLTRYDLVYFSGITLSLYSEIGRARLIELLEKVRANGGKVAFDGNYRPRGWLSAEVARQAFGEVLSRVDYAFPTLDDEQMLYGDANAEACAARLQVAGIKEIVVKQGSKGCLIASTAQIVKVPSEQNVQPVDTTAAGDSFNAGYLAARLNGAAPEDAARCGHKLAAEVIRHPGAIIPIQAMPDLAGMMHARSEQEKPNEP
jgi:2-dehydro-3-deoxygluconokinase